jgi:hypothetical protein
MYNHCPLQSTCWILAMFNSSIRFSPHCPHILHVLSRSRLASLGQTCYLELARGSTYTLHVSPPRNGGRHAVPEVLKGPSMSFLHLVLGHLLLRLLKG